MPIISFPQESHSDLELPMGSNLSEHLDIHSSPLLFGCRTGICGTCLIEILEVKNGEIAPPKEDEIELLKIVADGNPNARLACQLELTADISVKSLGEQNDE